MYKVVLFFPLLFLLLSCASKEEKRFLNKYKEQRHYQKNLMKSEKLQLYENNITKVMFTATYLNKEETESQHKNVEKFIVGIHVEENNETLEHLGEYSLRLNGKRAEHFTVLDDKSKLLKNIPFRSEWSYFYLVEFPYAPKKKLILSIENTFYGSGSMHFSKVAKYTFDREIF